jgi:hypothetical protein
MNYGDVFTNTKLKICHEVGCVEARVRDPRQLPPSRLYQVSHDGPDESALNYARVKYLNDTITDTKSVIKKLASGEMISHENELTAWAWYYDVCRANTEAQRWPLMNIIKKANYFAKKCRKIEKKWDNSDFDLTHEWTRLKHYENIYRLDISYKIILHKQIKLAANQIILHTNNELQELKNKYI